MWCTRFVRAQLSKLKALLPYCAYCAKFDSVSLPFSFSLSLHPSSLYSFSLYFSLSLLPTSSLFFSFFMMFLSLSYFISFFFFMMFFFLSLPFFSILFLSLFLCHYLSFFLSLSLLSVALSLFYTFRFPKRYWIFKGDIERSLQIQNTVVQNWCQDKR